jgi:hypothetical protein
MAWAKHPIRPFSSRASAGADCGCSDCPNGAVGSSFSDGIVLATLFRADGKGALRAVS